MGVGLLSMIGTITAAIAMCLVIAALSLDTLFTIDWEAKGTGQLETVFCKWDRRTFTDGTKDQMYKEVEWGRDARRAGELWLVFGIMSIIYGQIGIVFACINGPLEWLGPIYTKPVAAGFLFCAGMLAWCAVFGAFYGYWDDSNTCINSEESSLEYSVPLMFSAGIIFWIGMVFVMRQKHTK